MFFTATAFGAAQFCFAITALMFFMITPLLSTRHDESTSAHALATSATIVLPDLDLTPD
jgi:hypothetical protein